MWHCTEVERVVVEFIFDSVQLDTRLAVMILNYNYKKGRSFLLIYWDLKMSCLFLGCISCCIWRLVSCKMTGGIVSEYTRGK
jgi:hypothetical protein